MRKKITFDKKFLKYYLLGITIVILTVVIQSITQYGLKKQEHAAALINIAGKQRMLGQQVLADFYQCRLLKCNYADMTLGLDRLLKTNAELLEGDKNQGLPPVRDVAIRQNLKELAPSLQFLTDNLRNATALQVASFEEVSATVHQFLQQMDIVVYQIQKQTQEDLKALRVVELQLAAFSILIILLEIIFIINPAIKQITLQNKKLKEISWHQAHAVNSHIKNLKDLKYMLQIEKKLSHKQELVECVVNELTDLEQVSEHMKNAVEATETY